ncbi:MAG: efflux RND transporter permease subunit [Planctomycetes bacterium]|nr:efflux RND transporter permease subunit [Planctomycetota bacterium]
MNLLFIILIIAGVIVLNRLPIDVYPSTSLDIATVVTTWPGASSEEVERLVTRQIEEEIEDVRGHDRIYSVSQADASIITVKFREDLSPEETQAAFEDLRLSLDRVTDLPEDAEPPELQRITTDEVMPLLQIGVAATGEFDETVLRRITLSLKDAVRAIPNISKVTAIGLRDREIHIKFDKAALEKHGLSLSQVAQIVRANNMNLPAGYLRSGDSEITLRSVGEVDRWEDLGKIRVIRSASGAHVLLNEIAQIEESFERAFWTARVNGKPSMVLQVVKEGDANSLTVREDVGKCIDHFLANLDVEDIAIEIQADTTAVIASRLEVLRNNLSLGMVLVFLVLWVSIGFRNSALAAVGIPFSFLCATIFMWFIGVSINAVSVFSLVLVSGMIVDDAIVVLENIYHHVQQGLPLKEAVIRGTDEVVWPVVASTMTTIVAFLPMLVMSGVLGRFFSIVPKTVTVALLASLFECLLILPVHYLDWGPRKSTSPESRKHGTSQRRMGRVQTFTVSIYDRVLGQILAYRYLGPVVIIACALFVWQAQRTLVVEMFPSDFPTFVVDMDLKPGTNLEATAREVDRLAPIVDKFKPDRVVRSITAVGLKINQDNQRIMRTDIAQMWIDVKTDTSGTTDPVGIINDIRAELQTFLDENPDCLVESFQVWPIRDGPPVGKPVAIRVEHPDYDVARGIVRQIRDRLEDMPGVHDVTDNLQLGNRELVMRVSDERASEFGVTFLDVATALRGAKDGLRVGVFKDTIHEEDVDIKVQYADAFVKDVNQLLDIDVYGAQPGRSVKLHQVADLEFDQTYTNRYHFDGKRAVEITAAVDTQITDAKIVNETIFAEFGPMAEKDEKLTINTGGQFAETQESFQSLRQSAVIALGLMYLILASQFRSYVQPFVILTAVIFGVMGMVVGLVVNGYPFSVVTAIAMVGLSGVVVNDALVLLDFINKERLRGTPLVEAIRTASQRRLRAILLTTLTTVVGLAPMAMGVGGYSKIWSPFAMSMCWGIVFSTMLTLGAVPALYYIVEDVKAFFARAFPSKGATPDSTVSGSAQ